MTGVVEVVTDAVKNTKLNDKSGPEYSPGNYEVIRAAMALWKDEPKSETYSYAKQLAELKARNPSWALSEKRLKSTLREANLQTNQPLYTYVKETVSTISPDVLLPQGIKLQQTKARGVGLYTTRVFKAGDVLWGEAPLVQAPPVELLRLMRSGRCCAYCSRSLRIDSDGQLSSSAGVACINCTANWCSNACKRSDIIHVDTYHALQRSSKPRISINIWKEFEQFCIDSDWKAAYLFAVTLVVRIKSPPSMANNLKAMATIRQEARQKALSLASGTSTSLLAEEEYETMWRRGYALLARAVAPVYKLSYDEFMEGIGMVNINNLDNALFLIQSHMNHNCNPNTIVEIEPSRADGITVLAKRNIPAGQELTTSYVDPSLGVEERQFKLRVNWGFICSCERCKKEKAELAAPAETRSDNSHSSEETAASSTKPTGSARSENRNGSSAPDEKPISLVKDKGDEVTIRRPRSKSVHFEKNPVSEVCI